MPAFKGKRRQQSSLSNAINGATVAFANALECGNSLTTTAEKASSTGVQVHVQFHH